MPFELSDIKFDIATPGLLDDIDLLFNTLPVQGFGSIQVTHTDALNVKEYHELNFTDADFYFEMVSCAVGGYHKGAKLAEEWKKASKSKPVI